MAIDHIAHLTAPVPGQGPQRNRSLCKTFARFLCSNLGLLFVAIAYCVGGAFLFTLLEQYIELQNCQRAYLLENISIAEMSESIFNYVATTKDNESTIYTTIDSHVENFTENIYSRRSEYRYTGQTCETSSGWEFPSALLFTITVVASIGFGHITPTTWEGQITCICYALIGIPIFLLCLTNISAILGDVFRFLYSGLLHILCGCCRIYNRKSKRKVRDRKNSNITADGEVVGVQSTDPTWPDAIDEEYANNEGDEEYEDDEDAEMKDIWDRMESRVPTGLVLVVIVGYLCLGAVMFHRFEDWTMTESVYFCFITLSTIGFGDLVPGITSGSTSGLRFLAASMYIIIGLAILAMCFDLLKESMVEKFLWLGQKLGVTAEEEDDVDDEPNRYANFEYTQQPSVTPIPMATSRVDFHPPSEAPPAYEYLTPRDAWLTELPDKTGSTRRYGY